MPFPGTQPVVLDQPEQASSAGQIELPKRPGFPGSQPLDEVTHSLYDITAGAFEYGAADVGRSLAARLQRFSNDDLQGFGADTFGSVAKSLQEFKDQNPQYAPIQVDNAFDLLTSPSALVSHFSAGAPFLLAVAGLKEGVPIPFVGLGLAYGLSYAVESQNAFEQARASGADEATAGSIGNTVGVINAGLQTVLAGRIFGPANKSIGGAVFNIGKEALDNTLTAARALNLTGPALRSLAVVAAENATMGAVREYFPAKALGQKVPEGFIQRRLSETIDGAVLAEVMGGVTNLRDWAMGKTPRTTPEGDPASLKLDVLSQKDFENRIRDKFPDVEQSRIHDNVTIFGAMAKVWGGLEGKDPQEFFARAGQVEGPGDNVGELLTQKYDPMARSAEINNVKWSYSNMRKAVAEKLGNKEEVTVDELQKFLTSAKNGTRADEVAWTGIGDDIRSVAPDRRGSTKFKVADLLRVMDLREIKLATKTRSEADVTRLNQEYTDLQDSIQKANEEYNKLLTKGLKPEELQALTKQHQDFLDQAGQKGLQIREDAYNSAPRWKESQTPGDAWHFRNVLVMFPFTEGDVPGGTPRHAFLDEHWGEHNVIVDLHLDERQTPGGQTTHISELQAGAIELGQKVGFRERGQGAGIELVKATNEQGRETWELRSDGKVLVDGITDEESANRIKEQIQKGRVEAPSAQGQTTDVRQPAMPYQRTNRWAELGLKQAFWEAIQAGSRFLTWSTGDERAQVWGAAAKDGGEGLRQLQDKIVPSEALKLARKYDPKAEIGTVKVGETSDLQIADHIKDVVQRNRIQAALDDNDPRRISSFVKDGELIRTPKELFSPGIEITPTMSQKMMEEGFTTFQKGEETEPLMQSNRASVRMWRDALGVERALIRGGKDPDASSVLEELFHVAEKWIIRGDDRIKAEQAIGVEDNNWTIEKREMLAKMFLQYAREGKSADPLLQGAFSRMGEWMKEIYPSILKDERINGGKYKLGDELRGIFDRMYLADTDPVKAKRIEIQQLNQRLEALGAKPSDSTTNRGGQPIDPAQAASELARAEIFSGTSDGDVVRTDQGGGAADQPSQAAGDQAGAGGSESQTPRDPSTAAERRRLESELSLRRNELWDLQASQFRPGADSPQAARAKENNLLPGLLGSETKDESISRLALRALTEPWRRFMDATVGVRSYLSGKLWLEKRDGAEAWARLQTAKYLPPLEEAYKGLSKADREWLMGGEREASGARYPGIQRMLDQVRGSNEIVPSPAVERYLGVFKSIFEGATTEAQKAGVLRKVQSGAYVPPQLSELLRMPRVLSEGAYDAIRRGSGRFFNQMVKTLSLENPELTIDLIQKELKEYVDHPVKKIAGSLERSRFIKNFPAVMEFGGGEETLLRHDPYDLAFRTMQRQFGRIGWVKEFGQGVLRNVGIPVLKRILNVMGEPPDRQNKETIGAKLAEAGMDWPNVDKMTLRDLYRVAKDAGIQVTESREDLLGKVMSLKANDLYREGRPQTDWPRINKTLAELKNIAINIRGIDPSLEPATLLQAIKQRATEVIADDLHTQLRTQFAREGGDLQRFDQMSKLAQGVPIGVLPRNFYTKGARFLSNLIGASQTSTSAAPNLPQPLALVPGLAGLRNFAEAVKNVYSDPEASKSQIKALGAFVPDIIHRTTEPGYSLLTWGRKLQQAVGSVTGLRFLAERNNVIAGEAFRLMGVDWLKGGFGGSDVGLAKRLRLSDGEIGKIQKGGLDPDSYQQILAKIVQNGVNITQFVTEAPYRRGLLETYPIGRLLFSYFGYSAGMSRSLGLLMNEWKDALTSKEPTQLAGVLKRTVLSVAGTAGAGMASIMLRQALKGQLDQRVENQDDLLHKAWAGLWETQLFGGTQRMLEPFAHDQGVIQMGMIGLMPQVNAVANIFGAAMRYGKFGQFGFGQRVGQAVEQQVPAVRGIDNWFQQWAYPERSLYNRARAAVKSYTSSSEVGQKSGAASLGDQLNPEYWPTAEALANGDQQSVVDSARAFYAQAFTNLKPEQDPRRIVPDFRASLSNRAPIKLNDQNELKFLSKLPPEKRREFMQLQGRYMAMVDAVAPTQHRH